MAEPFVQVSHVSKSFGGVHALRDVSVSFLPGEVHALVGENGAGKSTLIKMISGYETPDSGEIMIGGVSHESVTVAESIAAGVGTVYQDALLAPHLSVAENVFMGMLPTRRGLVDKKRLNADAKKVFEGLGIEMDVTATVGDLALSQRQFVSIARALARGATMLIMDEPTAALAEADAEVLFDLVAHLARRGTAVIYITHRLEEVTRVADRVTAMRDGKVVATLERAEVTREGLVRLIAGRELGSEFPSRESSVGETVFRASDLSGKGVNGVSVDIHAGEILGVYGLMGSGASELGRLLYGASRITGGTLTCNDVDVARPSPSVMTTKGVGYVPSDRKNEAILPTLSVGENVTVSALSKLCRPFVVDSRSEQKMQGDAIGRLSIKTSSASQQVTKLSGGSQQKVVLARWLVNDSSLLVLDEPTQGVDVGARYELYEAITELSGQGVAIVMVSTDLPELLGMTDRILVMYDGQLSGTFVTSDCTQEEIVAAASGIER